MAPPDNHFKHSHTHTNRVKILRRFLPMVGVLAILSVVLWSFLESFFEKKIEGIPQKAQSILLHNKVLNPRMHSTDAKGNPFSIQAETATQSADSSAAFEKPCCELVGNKGQKIKLKSDTGFLNQDEQKFTYDENVHIETSDGYTVDTKKAMVDLKNQTVTGTEPVTAKGPVGTVTSQDGFHLDKEKQELHFKGPTKLVIYPKDQKEGAKS